MQFTATDGLNKGGQQTLPLGVKRDPRLLARGYHAVD
jgi:hypothetical protein